MGMLARPRSKGGGRAAIASGLAFAGVNAKLAVDCSALLQTLLRTSPKSRPHYCKPPPPENRSGPTVKSIRSYSKIHLALQ